MKSDEEYIACKKMLVAAIWALMSASDQIAKGRSSEAMVLATSLFKQTALEVDGFEEREINGVINAFLKKAT